MSEETAVTTEQVDESVRDGSPDDDGTSVDRLTRALEHEREERRQAKEELRMLREDDDAFAEFIRARGFELDENEDDGEYEDDEDDEDLSPYEQRLASLEEQNQELRQTVMSGTERRFREDFDAHVDRLAVEAELTLDEDDKIVLWAKSAAKNKGTPSTQGTEDAFKAFVEREEKRFEARMESYRKSKKAPRVPASGKTATEAPPDLDKREERVRFMTERMLASRDSV